MLAGGVPCAKVQPGTTANHADVLLEHIKALIVYWKIKQASGGVPTTLGMIW